MSNDAVRRPDDDADLPVFAPARLSESQVRRARKDQERELKSVIRRFSAGR